MAGDGVFSSNLVFCLFGKESDTFCDCFHFVLVWEPSLCLRETLGARRAGWGSVCRGAGGGETKSLCGAWGGPVGQSCALIKAWVRGRFLFLLLFHCESSEDWTRGRCFVECSLLVAVVPLVF